jgi:hypothetical protein
MAYLVFFDVKTAFRNRSDRVIISYLENCSTIQPSKKTIKIERLTHSFGVLCSRVAKEGAVRGVDDALVICSSCKDVTRRGSVAFYRSPLMDDFAVTLLAQNTVVFL